jgi:hypothetical protein
MDFFCILKYTEDLGTDPHPDPLVRGADPRIRIRTKMSQIRNTAVPWPPCEGYSSLSLSFREKIQLFKK